MLAGCGQVDPAEITDPAVSLQENDEGGLTIGEEGVSQVYVGDAFQVTALLPGILWANVYNWAWLDSDVTASMDYLSGSVETHVEATVRLSQLEDRTLEGEEQEDIITGHILVPGPPPDSGQEALKPTVVLTARYALPGGAAKIRLIDASHSEENGTVSALLSVPRYVSGRTKLDVGDIELTSTHIYQSGGVFTSVTSEPFLLSEERVRALPFRPGLGWLAIGAETSAVPDDMAWFHTSFTATAVQ
jgi:hypothetical protein